MKAAIFEKDFKLAKIDDLNELLIGLTDLPANVCSDVKELQVIIGSISDTRYPKFRDPIIPHERFNCDNAKKALQLAKRILDGVTKAYW